jgi:predicted permease
MLMSSLRYGLRDLRGNRNVAITAILTVALGIGISGAMFAVVYAVLLRPLPFGNSDRLVAIGQANQLNNHPGSSSLPNIRDWREYSRSFQDIAYWSTSFHNVASGNETESAADIRCSANLFSLLEARPALGRTFDLDEDGKDSVAVLSAATWRSLFSSDPNVAGRTIRVGSDQYTVIGVMPAGFSFPFVEPIGAVWIPIQPKMEWEDRNIAMLQAVGRLGNGVSVAAAQAGLTTIANRATGSSGGIRILVEDYRGSITGDVRAPLLYLGAAVIAVWLIACINTISLLLTRAVSRRRETALRCALGASAGQLLSQFLAESAIVGGGGGLLGLLLAYSLVWFFRSSLAYKVPFADAIRINPAVLGVMLFMSMTSALLVGIWPALQSYRTSPLGALREGGGSSGVSRRQRRLQDILVVCEVAPTLVLLLSAGLLLRTLSNLSQTPLGLRPDHLLIARLPLLPQDPARGRDVVSSVYDPLLRNLEQVPGVESAAISSILPMDANSTSSIPVEIFGRPNESNAVSTAEMRLVSRSLYRTLGIPLLSGRSFADSDTRSAPWAVVVNQAFVRKYFPDEDPLGQRVWTGDDGPHQFSQIVGVVGDTHQRSVSEPVLPEMDLCYEQLAPTDDFAMMLGMLVQVAVRTRSGPETAIPGVRAALQAVNPETPAGISTMQDIVDQSLSNQRLVAGLVGIFAACGLLIAIVGLYGLLAYTVSRSRRDIAVRMALGATRQSVVGLVVRHAALVVGGGIAVGVAVWYQTAQVLRGYIYGMGTHDAVTVVSVGLLLSACGVLASYVPARRASRIDPMAALRHE